MHCYLRPQSAANHVCRAAACRMFLRPMSDLGFFSGFQEAQGIMHALNSFEPSHVLQNVACEGVAAYETLWVRHMALRLGELDTYCMAVRVIECMKLSHVLLRCHTCWQNLTPLGWIPGRYTYTYAAARGIYRDRGAIYRSCKWRTLRLEDEYASSI